MMLRKARLRGRLGKLLLVLLGIGAALFVSELVVRLIFPLRMHIQFVPDRSVGFRHAPNQRVWWTNLEREYGVWFTTNSQGDPDVERTIDKPERVYRIAVVGDSMVEAAQVSQEERFTSLLERWLEEWIQEQSSSIQHVQVLNFGTMRYGTAQEWLYYQVHVRRYDPDLVMLVFLPTNDVKNNSFQLEVVRSGRPEIAPFFDLDGSGELIPGCGDFYANAVAEYAGPRRIYRWVRDRIRFVQVLDAVRERTFAMRHSSEREASIDLYDPKVQRTSEEWQQAWDLTAALLDQFARDVQRDGAAFCVVIASGPLEVNDGTRAIFLQEDELSGYDWQLANRLAKEMLSRLGLDYVDLLPAIEAASRRSAAPMHFIHDGHFTPAGHYVVATELLPVFKGYISQ
jgi:lysophospholipase L1-like esterase